MHSWGKLLVAAAALMASHAGLGAQPAGAEPSHPGGVPDTCPEVLAGRPTGGLEKFTQPPAGSEVQAGDIVAVTLRWDPANFDRPVLHKALDCVTVDGRSLPELGVQERDTANDGVFEHVYVVPDGLAAGTRLCDRGFVSGPTDSGEFDRQKSNDVCFMVGVTSAGAPGTVPAAGLEAPPAALPPAPEVQLIPPAGMDLDLDMMASPGVETFPPPAGTALGPPVPDVAEGVLQGTTERGTSTTAPTLPEAPTAEASGDSLPRTGAGVRPWLLLGLTLLVGGQSLRRLANLMGSGRRPVVS